MTARPGSTKVLILGGTGEALRLAERLSGDTRLSVTTSLAGRTRAHAPIPGQVRSGGFGGPAALAEYLAREGFGLVVDATHPYAAEITANAAQACATAGVPRLLLHRPPWQRQPGDTWIEATDTAAAARALPELGARVFLSIGRQELSAFAPLGDTWFLVRLVERPAEPLPLPRHELVFGRGPFTADDEERLLREHGIQVLVSKNSGGPGTHGKIAAARALGLPVVMIARPDIPDSETADSADAAADWVTARLP